MTKTEMTEVILEAKKSQSKTWEELGSAIGLDKVCIAAACFSGASLLPNEAEAFVKELGLGTDVAEALTEYPTKGVGQVIPSDPLIYRFFEIAYVYGPAAKSVIHEIFGDGIMSAIDFSMKVDKVEDPKGDRVKITYEGKFLPYKKW